MEKAIGKGWIGFWAAAMLVIIVCATRWMPHPPNFAPVGAVALFGSAYFADRRAALLVPLAGMLLSDLVLGFHSTIIYVYGAFALISLWGFAFLRGKATPVRTLAAAVGSTVIFFVVSNFGVWAMGNYYSQTAVGLLECYVAAIPFLGNTFLGDLFYSAVLFSPAWWALRRFSRV
jgi:hypothetical protein